MIRYLKAEPCSQSPRWEVLSPASCSAGRILKSRTKKKKRCQFIIQLFRYRLHSSSKYHVILDYIIYALVNKHWCQSRTPMCFSKFWKIPPLRMPRSGLVRCQSASTSSHITAQFTSLSGSVAVMSYFAKCRFSVFTKSYLYLLARIRKHRVWG